MSLPNYMFLLGGADLEMSEIRRLLDENKLILGKNNSNLELKWGAKWSDYSNMFKDKTYTFVGIELYKDIALPSNYINIDHHNKDSYKDSSLKRVIKLLKKDFGIDIKITRDMKLIAANDKGYIPAMIEMGATPEEIANIRQRDKVAQGVTEDDEVKADISIKKSILFGSLRVVQSLTTHFSTITDKLYPFDELLISNGGSMTYYGEMAALFATKYQELIDQNIAYSGGVGTTYFGIDGEQISLQKSALLYNEIKHSLIDMNTHSYHIFMFPFIWNMEKGNNQIPFGERYDLKKIKIKDDNPWEKIFLPQNRDREIEQYNERNYFYKFIHKLLYNSEKEEKIETIHFNRKEIDKTDIFYEIGIKGKTQYILYVKEISLSFFNTGAGVLSFHISNTNYRDLDDIKIINQYGRRIFPPFIGKSNGIDDAKNSELADYLKILGLEGDCKRYSEDFSEYCVKDYLKPAGFIENLILDLDNNLTVEPIIDDRMFTMCWAFTSKYSDIIKKNKSYSEFIKSNSWHEYLYVDSGESTCQNDEMQEKLLKDHTYPRWQKKGTLYGITRYSFMAISDESSYSREVTFQGFRTIYAKMVLLALVQRATVLSFSNEATDLSNIHNNDIESDTIKLNAFYQAYVQFINKVYHREVTAQDQGIELYDMLQENLRIVNQASELKKEINELFSYANFLKTEQTNSRMRLLTILAGLIVIPNFILTLMNNRFFKDLPGISFSFENKPIYSNFILLFFIVACSSSVILGLLYWDRNLKFGKKKWKNGKAFVLLGVILLSIYLLIFQLFI